MAQKNQLPNQNDLDEEDRLLEDDLFDDLDDDLEIEEDSEEPRSSLDLAVDLVAEILAMEGRTAIGHVALIYGPVDFAPETGGLYLEFADLEDEEEKAKWPLLDVIETRAIHIALALEPGLFGTEELVKGLASDQRVSTVTREIPDLSSHARIAKAAELRERLAATGLTDAQVSALITGPETTSTSAAK